MDCAFEVLSKESLPNPRSQRSSLMFVSTSYIVICFTFRSLIHYGIIFVNFRFLQWTAAPLCLLSIL